ncbi:MAG: radical SAM protein [Clostridia bacterium]|nr:radical SAM protein [Clostridia bacterium]
MNVDNGISPVSARSFPLWQLSRLRMATDGHGVTALVASFGCPLNCKYCINPQSHGADGKFRLVTPEELLKLVEIDNLYYLATGGGIMFGGGEPLLHADFIAEFRKIAPPEWHFYAETSLCVPEGNVLTAAGAIDHFYVDVKDTDAGVFERYTGVNASSTVIDNLSALLALNGPERITVRLPLIPEFNTPASVVRSRARLEDLGVVNFDLFTYKI